MIARGLLDRLKQASGYYFDERFFCYCEDTDLVLRSVLLGDFPAYIDTLIALHEGQASSGGKPNAFIAYHGLRNSIWMHAKLIPSSIFLKYGFFLAAAHLMLICRYVLFGRFSILRAIYRDAFSGLSEILAERKVFARQVIITPCDFERWIAPRFYRSGYFLQIVRDCVNR